MAKIPMVDPIFDGNYMLLPISVGASPSIFLQVLSVYLW